MCTGNLGNCIAGFVDLRITEILLKIYIVQFEHILKQTPERISYQVIQIRKTCTDV